MLGGHKNGLHVEGVLVTGLFVFGGETISKLRSMVGQDLANHMGEARLSRRRKLNS